MKKNMISRRSVLAGTAAAGLYGLTGARSSQLTYLEDILTDSLAGLAGRPAADIVSEMRKIVQDFSAGVLRDDLTMLALRVGEQPAS